MTRNKVHSYLTLPAIMLTGCCAMLVVTSHEENRNELLEEKTEIVEEQREVLMTQKEHADKMQNVVDFITANPRFIVITASPKGKILSVSGSLEVFGIEEDDLIGLKVEDLRPEKSRKKHKARYEERVKEGPTGEVFFFENKIMWLPQERRKAVNGATLWHHNRNYLVSFIAPTN